MSPASVSSAFSFGTPSISSVTGIFIPQSILFPVGAFCLAF